MALSPDQGTLYVARRSDPLAVVAIAMDRERGVATVQAESTLPASMAHLNIDTSGRWLFSASYAHLVAVQPLLAGGRWARHQCMPPDPTPIARRCTRLTNGYLPPVGRRAVAPPLPLRRRHRHAGAHRAAHGAHAPRHTGPRHLRFNRAGDRCICSVSRCPGACAVVRCGQWRHGAAANAAHAAGPLCGHCVGPTCTSPDGRWLYTSERNNHHRGWLCCGRRILGCSARGALAAAIATRGFALTEQGQHRWWRARPATPWPARVDSATGAR